MNTEEIPLLKTSCCGADVRTDVNQLATVAINEQGTIENVYDFSTPELSDDYYWCEKCGIELVLKWEEKLKKYIFNTN